MATWNLIEKKKKKVRQLKKEMKRRAVCGAPYAWKNKSMDSIQL